jgi:hypothetical protein
MNQPDKVRHNGSSHSPDGIVGLLCFAVVTLIAALIVRLRQLNKRCRKTG